jgi:AcrR family transcriptional regulator
MRQIAAEADVTTGALQHHFRSKEEMLLFTLDHHGRRWADRLRERAARGSGSAPPRRVLAAIIRELLPLDEERTEEACVAATFVLRAAGSPELSRHYASHRRILHDLVREQCMRAGVPNPAATATLVLQTVEGMRTDCLLLGPEAADVDGLLDRLLP